MVMTWNYRVIEDKEIFRIHEVYYNNTGAITAISEDPITPEGETMEELKGDLEYYFQALKKPVLKKEDIVFVSMMEED